MLSSDANMLSYTLHYTLHKCVVPWSKDCSKEMLSCCLLKLEMIKVQSLAAKGLLSSIKMFKTYSITLILETLF